MEIEVGSNIEPSLEENEEPPILIPCTVCGRTFKSESLRKHQGVCQKNATKKRKVFDSMKQRIQGTELAEYISIPVPHPKPKVSLHKGGNKSKGGESSHHTNTPVSSERSRPVVRSNSVSTSTPSRGAAFKEEKCPHCDRTFGWKAFSRHEEWCREHKTRVAQSQSPASVVKAKEMLEARIKYRAPLVGKLKRPTNREKYAHGAGVIGMSPMTHSYHKSSVIDVHHQKISSPKSTVSSSNKENRNKSTPKTSTASCPGFGSTHHHQVTRKVSAPVKREPSPQKEIAHIINPPWDLNISNEEVEESKESSSDSRNRNKCQECCNELFKLESNEIELVSDFKDKRNEIGTRGIIKAQETVLKDGKLNPSTKEKRTDDFVKDTVIKENGRKNVFMYSSVPSQERNCGANASLSQENDIDDSSNIGLSYENNHENIGEDSHSGFDFSDSRTPIFRNNVMNEFPQSVEPLSKEVFNHWGQGDINQSNVQDDRDGRSMVQILEIIHGSSNDRQVVDEKNRQMDRNIKTLQLEPLDPIEKGNTETLFNSVEDLKTGQSSESFDRINYESNSDIQLQKMKEKSKKKMKLGSCMKSFEKADKASYNQMSMLSKTNPDTFRSHSLATWKNIAGSNCSFRETAEVDMSVDEGYKNITSSPKTLESDTSWLVEKETAQLKNGFSTFSPKCLNKAENQKLVAVIRKDDENWNGKRSRLPIPFPKRCIDHSLQTFNEKFITRGHKFLAGDEQKPSSDDFKSEYRFDHLNNTFILGNFKKSKELGMNYSGDNKTPESQNNSFESSHSGTSPEIRKGIIRKCHPEDYEARCWKEIQESCDQPLEISSSACATLNEYHPNFNEVINTEFRSRKNSYKRKEEDNLSVSLSGDSYMNDVVSYKFTNLSKSWERCERANFNDVTTGGNKLFHSNSHQSCIKVKKEGVFNVDLKGKSITCSGMLPNENDYDNSPLLDIFNKNDTPLLLEDLSTGISSPQKQQSKSKKVLANDTYILSNAIDKYDERILDVAEGSQKLEDSNEVLILERHNYHNTNKFSLHGRKEKNGSAGNEILNTEGQIYDLKKGSLNSSSSATQDLKAVSVKNGGFRLKSKRRKIKSKSNESEAKQKFDSEKRSSYETKSKNELLVGKDDSQLNLVSNDLVYGSSIENVDIIDPSVKNSSFYVEKAEESDNNSSIDKSIGDCVSVSNKDSPRSKYFSSQKTSLPSVNRKIKLKISHSHRLKNIVGKYSPLPRESSSEDNMGSGNTNCDVLLPGSSTTNSIILNSEDYKGGEKNILKERFFGTNSPLSPCNEKVESSLKNEQLLNKEVSEECRFSQPNFPTIKTSGERDILCNQMEWLNLIQKFHDQGSNTIKSQVDIQKLMHCSPSSVCKPFLYFSPKENVLKGIDKHEKHSNFNSTPGKISSHVETSGLLKNSLSKEETPMEGNQFSLLQRKLAEDRVRKRLAKKDVLPPEENLRSHCPPRTNSLIAPKHNLKKESESTSYKRLPSMIHLSTNYGVEVRSCQSSPSESNLHQQKSSEDDRSAVSPMEKPSFRLSTYDPFSKAEMQLRELLSDGYESQNPKILLSSPLDEDQKKQVPDNHNSYTSHTDSSHKNGNLHLHNIFNNQKKAKEDVLPDLFTETSTQLHFEMPNLMRGRDETVMTKRRAMKPTALNMGIDLNPSNRESPNTRRNYMLKPADEKFDSNEEYISSRELEGEISEKSHSSNSNINMETGGHLDIDSIHQSINLVALGLSNLSTNSNESLVDVDNNNAVSEEKTLALKTNDVDSSGNLIAVDQKLVLSSHTANRHSSGESDGDAKRIRRRKRRGKTLPEGETREDISSPESLVAFQNPASAKLSVDSAYSSLNRPSFRALEDCKRVINKAFDHHQHQNSSEGENDHADEWSEDEDSKKRSSNWKPDPPIIDSNDFKLAKFCHECGSKYPLTEARFCCVCGARRLAV